MSSMCACSLPLPCLHCQVIIQRTDGGPKGQRLPVAHTCFNVLDLPPYGSEAVMKQVCGVRGGVRGGRWGEGVVSGV